ncbi:hypothetical protein ACFXKC_55715 [Streptomyces sp. NPDC059340]|uniref:hypothetical protein n=1 Tax=Streptomyces sp. NPDC059340 TaxID=3346806 RepID=UPI0036A36054
MNNGNGLDLRTALLLLAGGFGAYIAFLHPAIGVALLVGIGVMTVLHLLLK